MRDGMIVLDVRGNIVDINNAAALMIGVPVANAIGKTANDVFQPWSHLVERFRNVMEGKGELFVGEGEARRGYEVRLSPLQDPQGQLVGRVIMLRAMDDEVPQQRLRVLLNPQVRPSLRFKQRWAKMILKIDRQRSKIQYGVRWLIFIMLQQKKTPLSQETLTLSGIEHASASLPLS